MDHDAHFIMLCHEMKGKIYSSQNDPRAQCYVVNKACNNTFKIYFLVYLNKNNKQQKHTKVLNKNIIFYGNVSSIRVT